MSQNPQIDPIFKKGTNKAAVLLLHGFTGTPDSIRPLANTLHSHGFTVMAPLLAGHGTTPEQLAQTDWKHWYTSAQAALKTLNKNHEKIFVAGLSMGGLLSLKLAIDYPKIISAISCLATPLYLQLWIRLALPLVRLSPARIFWKYQKKYTIDVKDEEAKSNFWSYHLMPLSCVSSLMDLQDKLRSELSRLKHPLLLMHSRHDHTAPYGSMGLMASLVSSPICEMVTLENSYHIITIDNERELVAKKVTDFFGRFV